MGIPLRVLFVDDSPDDILRLEAELHRGGYDLRREVVDREEALRARLNEQNWDAVISECSLPALSALEVLAILKERQVDIPMLVVSGAAGDEVLLSVLWAGACDFIPKADLTRLVPALRRALEEAAGRCESRAAESALRESEERFGLLEAQKMEAVRLAGEAAHELNNLMTAIMGYSDLMLRRLSPADPLRHDVQEIAAAAERGAILSRQLQAFGRADGETVPDLTLKIELPRSDAPGEASLPERDRRRVPRGSETVLLVEEEDAVRGLLREALRSRGYMVLEACDGAQAFRLAEAWGGPLHLLLSDVVMPEMKGRELADRLSELRPELRVLFLSGGTDTTVESRGLIHSGEELLQKPFQAEALVKKVREVLDLPPPRTSPV